MSVCRVLRESLAGWREAAKDRERGVRTRAAA
jgi:hypothetical protein